MSLADIKARIAAQIKLVAGIGKVYPRLRLLKTEADFAASAISEGSVNIWMVDLDSSAGRDLDVNQHLTEYTEAVTIDGYFSFNDANQSLDTFQTLAYAVRDAINADRIPPSLLSGLVNSARPVAMKFDTHEYGPQKVLCHHVRMVLPVVLDASS